MTKTKHKKMLSKDSNGLEEVPTVRQWWRRAYTSLSLGGDASGRGVGRSGPARVGLGLRAYSKSGLGPASNSEPESGPAKKGPEAQIY